MELLNTPIESPEIIVLTILYFIVASITTFDIRLNQEILFSGWEETSLPKWVAILYWLLWAIWIYIFYLNWKYALTIFVIKFILKVLPVLESVGNILMSPFKSKK